MTIRRGRRKGEAVAKLSADTRERLDWLGRERSLVYKTFLLTGLRRGELEAITVGQLCLDSANPVAVLNAADEKNREGSEIAIRSDLAADLRQWLSDRPARLQAHARRKGDIVPERLPANVRVFIVPKEFVKILNRDLRLAGIPKMDDRGRVLDIHALRHTFGTLLSKGGVAPRTAQEAMRHSDIALTMNVTRILAYSTFTRPSKRFRLYLRNLD
jgi:integrase